MSDTPRTDEVARMPTDAYPNQVVDVKFARELERENAKLREALAEVRIAADCITATGSANRNHIERIQRLVSEAL